MEQLWMQRHSTTIFSSCFLFKATHCFCINCSFFQTPHSFHDDLALVHPHGNNYYPLMARMHFDIIHSSKCHHHHLSLHPSSFIISTICVVVYFDLIISSFNLSTELVDFISEPSYLSMILITKLPLLILWLLWHYFVIFIYIIILMDSFSSLIYGLWFLPINWFLYFENLHLRCNKLVWF
jgi:hypothetical protein